MEAEFVVFKFDAGGQDAFASQANGEIAIDRPVVFGGEFELFVVDPEPDSGDGGGEVEAGGDALIHLLERGGRFAELDEQGVDLGLALVVI